VSGLIPKEVIEEVKARTDIVQIVGQHVELKRSGTNHKGLCPFHEEKTPSFNVNSQRQMYHCFGCHESGDVIKFLRKIEGRSFEEVLEDLAARAGVDVPRQRVSSAQAQAAQRRRSDRQRGLDLNRRVAVVYRELLQGQKGQIGQDYLRERGIGDDVSSTFQIGYAPRSGDAVVQMVTAGADGSTEFAERLGLIAKRANRPGHHDRFWNRLIFPVVGAGGEVLGFGGRLLGDGDGPKYINTPETFMYRKGEALYGLGPAAKPIRQQGVALLVEGNFDVLQLHQAGFANAVAPMGTALTERQVLLLRRFAPRAVAIFDGDEAGQAAAQKAVPILLAGGVEAKIASLPRGQDPDSFLCREGPEAMAQTIERAVPAIEYLVGALRNQMEDSIQGRARVLERVAQVVALLKSRAERDLYAGQLALELKTDVRTVQREIHAHLEPGGPVPRPRPQRQGPTDQSPELKLVIPKAELDVLGILVDHPHLVPRAEQAGLTSLLTNEVLRATYRAAVEMQQTSGQIDPVRLLETASSGLRDKVADVVMSEAFSGVKDPTRALDDCLNDLRRRRLERDRQEIRNQMAKARAEGNSESERVLARRMIEVEREIHETR
jgi:DNA primase